MNGKELLDMKVSYYGNVKYNTSSYTVTIKEWVSKYSLKYKGTIEKIREIYNEDIDKAKKMKQDVLPCVTMSGIFESYRRIDLVKQINPILAIDIDKKDNMHIEDWDKLKLTISNLPYVFLVSYSVSGKGIYVLVYYDMSKPINDVFNALRADFRNMGINIDVNCKDVTRLRFVSYDDNMLIRLGDVQMYNKTLKTYYSFNTGFVDTKFNVNDMFTYKAIYHLITECKYQANDYNDWLKDGFRLSNLGTLGYVLFMLLSKHSDNYDEEYAKQKFLECQRTSKMTKSSLSYYFAKLKDIYGANWAKKIN